MAAWRGSRASGSLTPPPTTSRRSTPSVPRGCSYQGIMYTTYSRTRINQLVWHTSQSVGSADLKASNSAVFSVWTVCLPEDRIPRLT
jgi:hypothetical protein